MKFYFLALFSLLSLNTYAVSKTDIKNTLDSRQHRCMNIDLDLGQENKPGFVSFIYIECTHYSIVFTTNLYFDNGFNSYKANNILSHTHDNKTLSSILKYPASSSILKDYRKNADSITIDFMDKHNFKAFMNHIYKQRLPYSMHTSEYLKILDSRKGMFITQQVDVNFLKFDEAYTFLESVLDNYYHIPLSSLIITN